MGNIVLLDELTINKIAAGEVIERPASVVKELVENSIDAGANKITIEIKNGGISYIRITDNGKGIMPDDMEIAFERHATSKIRQADDLNTVKSMGFRGEALASIAAISHVEMVSKSLDNEIGCKVEVQGGNIINREDAGCPQGTTITVTDLFFNTPVRYKFLKKDFTEAGYIEDVVTRIALIHPEIAIKLINTGKTIIQTSGTGDMKSVVYSIYGKDVAENIIDINYAYEDITITGVIGKPAIARSNRSNQLFFVNKRYIKDKILTSAAEQGYKGLLTIGKYGFLVLNIEMNPQKVDVNVHPAKLEVRFEEENKVFKAIYHAIKDGLLKADLVPGKTSDDKAEENKLAEGNTTIVHTIANATTTRATENPWSIHSHAMEKTSGGLFSKFMKRKEEKLEDELRTQEVEKSDTSVLETDKLEENTETLKTKTYGDMAEIDQEDKELDANNWIAQIYKKKNKIENAQEEKAESNIGTTQENMQTATASDTKNTNSIKTEGKDYLESQDTMKIENSIEESLQEKSNEETKKIPIEEISEKMKELGDLKIEADYQDFDEMYARTFGRVRKEEKLEEETPEYQVPTEDLKTAENVSIFDKEKPEAIPNYKIIGIAFSTYIIIEMDKELYIIDQHAAHERIMYEKIKKNYYSDTDKDSQLMLLPDIINLSHRDMEIAKDNMEIFEKAGFVLEEFGENTIKLSGVPNICLDLDTKELFLETLDEINTVARTAKQEIEEKFIATVACKAAVKANMALTNEEVDNLMKQLLVLPNPFTCPHGRPTAIRMSKADIEKKFSRR